MWKPYAELSATYFKEAKHLVDKYHYVRQVIWAFERVRKKIQKKFGKENHECVVVEDSFAGIHAAVSAGMHTIGIGDAETLKEAELIVSDTAGENFEIIKKWLQK